MRGRYTTWLTLTLLVGAAGVAVAQEEPLDYPQWRGANRDGAAAAFTEPDAWPTALTRQWQVDTGLGYATPILVGERVYTFGRQDTDEVVMALDAATGAVAWRTGYDAPFRNNAGTTRHGPGPKSTPLFYSGKLFTLGINGVVSAFDATDGALLWQQPVEPLYATALSPVADNGRVIFHVGGHNAGALTAFDADSGDVVWRWDGDGPGYASPMVAELDGVRQVVTVTQEHIVGVAADTGDSSGSGRSSRCPRTTPSRRSSTARASSSPVTAWASPSSGRDGKTGAGRPRPSGRRTRSRCS